METEETFELVWHIPLNGSASKISKTDRYLKNGEVVEAARRDGRPGVLRSQLTFTPEGHVHIRCRAPPCLRAIASFCLMRRSGVDSSFAVAPAPPPLKPHVKSV